MKIIGHDFLQDSLTESVNAFADRVRDFGIGHHFLVDAIFGFHFFEGLDSGGVIDGFFSGVFSGDSEGKGHFDFLGGGRHGVVTDGVFVITERRGTFATNGDGIAGEGHHVQVVAFVQFGKLVNVSGIQITAFGFEGALEV